MCSSPNVTLVFGNKSKHPSLNKGDIYLTRCIVKLKYSHTHSHTNTHTYISTVPWKVMVMENILERREKYFIFIYIYIFQSEHKTCLCSLSKRVGSLGKVCLSSQPCEHSRRNVKYSRWNSKVLRGKAKYSQVNAYVLWLNAKFWKIDFSPFLYFFQPPYPFQSSYISYILHWKHFIEAVLFLIFVNVYAYY